MRFITSCALILCAGSALADPIVGLWKTDPGEMGVAGLVEISACGTGYCGVIMGAADGKGDPSQAHLLGRKVFWDMVPDAQGNYSGGSIWSPKRNMEVSGRITVTGDQLHIEGCKLGVCKSGGRWQRVE